MQRLSIAVVLVVLAILCNTSFAEEYYCCALKDYQCSGQFVDENGDHWKKVGGGKYFSCYSMEGFDITVQEKSECSGYSYSVNGEIRRMFPYKKEQKDQKEKENPYTCQNEKINN